MLYTKTYKKNGTPETETTLDSSYLGYGENGLNSCLAVKC